MRTVYNLGSSYGRNVGGDSFKDSMRQVLLDGNDESLPQQHRSYGSALIRDLLALRDRLELPVQASTPAAPTTRPTTLPMASERDLAEE